VNRSSSQRSTSQSVPTDDGQTAALEVEGQVPRIPGPTMGSSAASRKTSRHAARHDGRRHR
jgi:hypothetical protein